MTTVQLKFWADPPYVEKLQGELLGRWEPSSRCSVHLFSKRVSYGNIPWKDKRYERDISVRKVLSIHLCGLNLTAFPPTVFLFQELREFHAAKNDLVTLPPDIRVFSNLRTLDLSDNALVELPAEIVNLFRLKSLKVNRNPLERPPQEVIRQGLTAIRAYLRYAPATPVNSGSPFAPLATSQLPRTAPTPSHTNGRMLFISYSRSDQAHVDSLAKVLQKKGYGVWIDNSNLTPGTPDWERAIRNAIRSCHAVILMASPNSRQSMYVKDELELARTNAKRVIPLWISGDNWMNSIPLGWGQTQYIDGRGEQFATSIELLASAIRDEG